MKKTNVQEQWAKALCDYNQFTTTQTAETMTIEVWSQDSNLNWDLST